MTLIHHVVAGTEQPPVVLVHGFGCSHRDWSAQVAHLAGRHQTIAVDLPGHGASGGKADACSVERYGADVAEVMRALDLANAVLVGHSMGCRVVTEAALQAPERVAGVILIDGSQFAPAMGAALRQVFAEPGGYAALLDGLFRDMFTAKSDPSVVAAVIERARQLSQAIGETMLSDLVRYDVGRFRGSLADLRVPVMAMQTTYSNERRERETLRTGQSTPFLDMLRAAIPSVRIEVIPDTGHFPQLDEAARTNALIDGFLTNFKA